MMGWLIQVVEVSILILLIIGIINYLYKKKSKKSSSSSPSTSAQTYDSRISNNTNNRAPKGVSNKPDVRQGLPIPRDARDALTMFCEISNRLCSLTSHIGWEGEAWLMGGVNASGKGFAYFSFTNDVPLTDILKHDGVVDIPHGEFTSTKGVDCWFISTSEDDTINLKAENLTGYYEWLGFDENSQGFSDDALARKWERSISSIINNAWPTATITNCTARINRGSGDRISYEVNITTPGRL